LPTSRFSGVSAPPLPQTPGSSPSNNIGPSTPPAASSQEQPLRVDWSWDEDVEVEIRKAAAIVAHEWRGMVPFDDLLQEGRIYAATRPAQISAHGADPERGITYWGWALRSALVRLCEREALHHSRFLPTEPHLLAGYRPEENVREFAIRTAHEYADDPGPRGEAAREYLAYLADEHRDGDDLAQARHLTEQERAQQWRCLACARKLPEECGHMRKFCTRACQRAFYRERRQAQRAVRHCGFCAEPIPRHKRAHAVWCSARCSDRARRQRERTART
jgi:hypothetical protein